MKKRKRTFLILSVVVLLSILLATGGILWQSQQYEQVLRPFVQGGYTQSGVSLPDDPRYVLMSKTNFWFLPPISLQPRHGIRRRST